MQPIWQSFPMAPAPDPRWIFMSRLKYEEDFITQCRALQIENDQLKWQIGLFNKIMWWNDWLIAKKIKKVCIVRESDYLSLQLKDVRISESGDIEIYLFPSMY